MARKPTDKQLFKMKNEWLGQFYEEVKPRDFYRAVFPEGSFEREGHPEDEKCNGVLTVIEGEKARKPCSIGVLCRAYKGGNPYQSSFTADTGTYRLCADKVVCKRVYEVERILLN